MSKQKHSASSGRWLKEHFDDKYANEARKKGYRSRAYFKIEEIQEKKTQKLENSDFNRNLDNNKNNIVQNPFIKSRPLSTESS